VTATDAATDSSFWPLSSGGPGIRILWQRQQEANKQRSNANTRQMGSRHPGIQGSSDPGAFRRSGEFQDSACVYFVVNWF